MRLRFGNGAGRPGQLANINGFSLRNGAAVVAGGDRNGVRAFGYTRAPFDFCFVLETAGRVACARREGRGPFVAVRVRDGRQFIVDDGARANRIRAGNRAGFQRRADGNFDRDLERVADTAAVVRRYRQVINAVRSGSRPKHVNSICVVAGGNRSGRILRPEIAKPFILDAVSSVRAGTYGRVRNVRRWFCRGRDYFNGDAQRRARIAGVFRGCRQRVGSRRMPVNQH